MARHAPGGVMASEMAEQPEVLRALAERRGEIATRLAHVASAPPAGIVLIARGSSDNAAVYGRYALQLATGLPVSLAAPSLHTLYDAPLRAAGWLAIAVSQSGRTPEITAVLRRFMQAGATGVAVTNEVDSPLFEAADVGVALGAGAERAVPATKTFTAQVAAIAAIAEALGPVPWSDADWGALPAAVAQVLADPEPAAAAARTVGEADGMFAVGRGFAFPVALEAALKIKETTGILAEGISAADLRHGPIAVVDSAAPVLAFCLPGPAAADMAELCATVRARGATVVEAGCADGAQLPLPPRPAEALLTIPATVRAQQLALELALLRGMDPDQPTGLTKVTPTV